MMTSRECVQRAIKFKKPDRIPLGTMPPGYPTDLCGVGASQDPNWQPKVKTDLQNEDEFGCIWTKLPGDKTMGQVTFHPLADFSKLDDYKFPDYKNPVRYDCARDAVKKNAENNLHQKRLKRHQRRVIKICKSVVKSPEPARPDARRHHRDNPDFQVTMRAQLPE